MQSDKRILIAFVLCFFFGVFGIHRFYLGRTTSGVIQLLTLGGLGIWAFFDMIFLALGSFEDGNGLPVKQWT